ncbi:MAG: nucleoside triphosphate pyrophosphatase [Dehalococcoidia bacterium]
MTFHCSGPARDLVLASASPRRSHILRTLGLSFEVDPADVDETPAEGAPIHAVVATLSLDKARTVAGRHASALVIAADTLVELDGRILSKPVDAADARSMLATMSGRQHRVATGLVLLDAASGDTRTRIVETQVVFRPMSDDEIEAYVATGEPLDKAGSYGIQGLGAGFVERIDGDYYNVAGLPVAALNDLLREAGCCIVCRNLRSLRD